MTIPETYMAYRRTTGDLPRSIEASTEKLPSKLGSNDVLIKIHAVSLNFRDVAMLNGRYPVEVTEQGVPCSDCAAEVVAIGPAVKDVAIGDPVSVLFDLNNLAGHYDDPTRALGGDVDGVLLGDYPLCWHYSMDISRRVDFGTEAKERPHASLGTGGVSMFALLICIAAGIQPIITSSSDKKLEGIKKLDAAVRGINYKTTTDQMSEVRRLTDDKGVDFVINNTGPASIPEDISFLRQRGGTVSLVGFLDGVEADWKPSAIMGLMMKSARIKGITTGSRQDNLNLNQFLADKKVSLAPLIDRVFSLDESPAAFDYLYSGSHVGKVVIKVSR